jgi:hypothetical protein
MTTPRRPVVVAVFAALLLGAGCSERDPPPPAAPSADVAPAATDAGTPTDAPPPLDDATPAAPSAAASGLVVVLEDDALRVVETASGSSQRFGLGSDEQAVVRAITRALPGPQTTTDGSGDCANNTVHLRDADLVLYFSEGTFAGWYLGDRGTLRTAAGYGVGSTRAELEAVADPDVGDDGLGLEFVAGTIVGGLDSETADAKITDLRSGDTCVMS